LLQLLFEAGCLEWSFIVSVFLRDALAVQRLISIARSPEHSYESVSRLKQAFILLYQWSCNEWYYIFIHNNLHNVKQKFFFIIYAFYLTNFLNTTKKNVFYINRLIINISL